MNRFRTGCGAPPWPPRKPVTQALEISEYMPASDNINRFKPTPPPTNTAPMPEPPATEKFARVELVYTAAASEAERAESQLPQRQGTAFYPELRRAAVPQHTEHSGVSTPEVSARTVPSGEAEPPVEDTTITLDDLPAFKAAMESLEERGDPIFISIDPEPSVTQPVYTEGDLPERAPKRRRRAKPKRRRISARRIVRPAVPRKQSRPKTQTETDESHHERCCTICHHPEREFIEEAFCQWRNAKIIARDFTITGGRSAVYRHARALKLFKQRNLCLRSSLEFVIEQSERIMPTAEGLVKAIRAYTRINDAGEWIDTPTTHIIQVMPMPSTDARNLNNSAPGLTLNVRKHPDDIIESATPQPLLPGTASQVEIAVTD